MRLFNKKSLHIFNRFPGLVGVFLFFILFTQPAHADLMDAFNLSPFVPLVLETMMNIATSLYNYFVGQGDGIIYILIYLFLGFYISLYLVKIYLPKDWLGFMGFSEGGDMAKGDLKAWSIVENVAKPCVRTLIACIVLLQIKPVYVTEWLVNPFLEFGSVYTQNILGTINSSSVPDVPQCPDSILQQGWITQNSCDFLIQPVYKISDENNKVVKKGLDILGRGLLDMLSPIPHIGFLLNIITGLLLISVFVSANVFMSLLIIQAIFDFCLSLIMYPFNVLAWVAKKSDKWFDVLPVFDQIIDSLKKLVICMIACAFILCINIAVVRTLFSQMSTESAWNLGQHFMSWLSSILMFFLLHSIFKMTQERLEMYTKGVSHDLYKNVTGDAKTAWNKAKAAPGKAKSMWDTGKAIVKKIKK